MTTRKPMSAATKAKISRALKGRKHPHKGHRLSAAARAKISAALRGKHHKGHKESAATRAKISAALRRRDAAKAKARSAARAARKATSARKRPRTASRFHLGTQYGPTARQRRSQPVKYTPRRNPFSRARVRAVRLQDIAQHRRLSSLNRRRRRFG